MKTKMMTKIVSNVILLIMVGVWAYISFLNGEIVEVSTQFVALAAAVAGGDVATSIVEKNKKDKDEDSGN